MSKRKQPQINAFFSKRGAVEPRPESPTGNFADTLERPSSSSATGHTDGTEVLQQPPSGSISTENNLDVVQEKETYISTECTRKCCGKDFIVNQPSDPEVLKKTEKIYTEKMHTKTRLVQAQWFQTFAWLTLCETKQKLFCNVCRFVGETGKLTFSKNAESAFITDGFGNWKRAIERLKRHENSLCHEEASAKYLARKQQHVISLLSEQNKKQQEIRRHMLIVQLESMSFLLRQGLAIRGHRLDEGNLIELLKLRSRDLPELASWLQQGKYLSPDILNELISVMANTVLRKLLTEIRKRKWFSVIADETSDITNHEQFNISVRWVDNKFSVHEDPLGIIWVPNTSGETLFKALTDVLIRLELPIANCRGQAYDGASNMQGKVKGVATRLLEVEPAAIRVHCLAHCLNLCVQEISRKSQPVRDAIDLISEIIRLIKWSPKRSTLFEQMKIDKSPENPNLRKLCPTRWTMRTASVDSVIKNYSVLMETLTEVNQTGTDEYARQAGGQVALMEKFSTYFGMQLSHLMFSASEQLSRTLQNKQTSVQDALQAAALAKAFYERQRDDAEFERFYDKVLEEARNIDQLGEPVLPRRRRVPNRIDDGSVGYQFESPKNYYRRQYFEVIDIIHSEISHRFSNPSFVFVQKIEELLINSANGKPVEIPPDIRTTYGGDIDMARLEIQLKMLPDLVRSQCPSVKSITKIDTIVHALGTTESSSNAVTAMMDQVSNLVQIYLTIPISSSTSERSFSTLRRIKTYLRNTMSQERLNHCMTCHIFKEETRLLDISEIAREFVGRNDMREKFFGTF